MTLNEYQEAAAQTRVYPLTSDVVYPVIGLMSEVGEVASILKRVMRDNKEIDCKKLIDELGDCLWYLSNIAYDIGATLEEVAQMNVDKLRSRKERNTLHGQGGDR